MVDLHPLNGQLLESLQRILAPIVPDWSQWIVNSIILRREYLTAYTVSLKTSATLYHGKRYYSHKDCDDKVKALDGLVPLDDSYAGHCLRSGSVLWVDGLEDLEESDPLREAYRSFKYVGVNALRPVAEYVFPIKAKFGFTETLLGVLNLEWYGPTDRDPGAHLESPFVGHRNILVAKMTALLELHGVFIAALLGLPGLLKENVLPGSPPLLSSSLLHCHSIALNIFEEANSLEIALAGHQTKEQMAVAVR